MVIRDQLSINFIKMIEKERANVGWLKKIALLTGGVFLLFLGLYHQPYYPVTWLDEGFVLQGAINLVRYKEYAMRSIEGFRIFDQPLIANGPGVVLPISAAFEIFGVGLYQARLVMVLFFTVATFLFFFLARRLYGTSAAFISTFLLLGLPYEGFLFYGRQALGLVPTLFYFLIGYHFWLEALNHKSKWNTIWSGLFFGLTLTTKGQYFLLLPILVAVALFDWFYYKQGAAKKIVLILITIIICLAVWYGSHIFILGWSNFLDNLDSIRSSSSVTITAFHFGRVPGNIWYLVRSGVLLVILPGWLSIGWSLRVHSLDNIGELLLFIFVPVWLIWFIFVSVGWHRYSFDPYAIGTLFAGRFILNSYNAWKTEVNHSVHACFNKRKLRFRVSMITAVVMIIAGGGGFLFQVKNVVAKPDTTPQDFAQYLTNRIGPGSLVESWEWEIDPLTPDIQYHHPTNDWVDKMTDALQFGVEITNDYDISEYKPNYLIDGPFSKWTQLYQPFLSNGCCTRIFSAGAYDLYAVKAP